MTPEHRTKINELMPELIEINNLNSVIQEMERRKITFPDMIKRVRIQAQKESKNLAVLFFQHLQRRGPLAFKVLVQTLHLTGNAKIAYLLDADSFYISEEELNKLSISTGTETPLSNASSTSSLSLLSPRTINGHRTEPLSFSDSDPPVSDSEFDESKLPLKIVVRQSELYNQGKTSGCYEMMSKPRGFALIINIITFEGCPEKLRLGAQHDSDNLKTLLEAFGYEVTPVFNVRKQALLDKEEGILKLFTEKFYQKDVDSCFVAIMSHGDDHFYIDMADRPRPFPHHNYNRVHLWDEIIPFFNNENFTVFLGKPKIFLIQACRGHRNNMGVPVPTILEERTIRTQTLFDTSSRSAVDITVRQVPQLNHIFILQSTIPGYKAMRDKYRGSWFVECVCDVFMNHAWNHSFDELYTKVAQQLERLITLEGNMQSCDYQQIGFGLKIYFNPGLYADDLDSGELEPSKTVEEGAVGFDF